MPNIETTLGEFNPIEPGGSGVPFESYEADILNWVSEAVAEGEGIIKDEPAYNEIDKHISYIMGDQIDQRRPTGLSNCPDNRLKTILNQTVAALTDIHPLFGFKTYNADFKDQEDVLVKLSQAWWVNTFADLKLADVIKFAAGLGTGYCEVSWDASAGGGAGDIVLHPLDPRDVLPIRPQLNGSVQDWEGVIIRSAKSPGELKVRFPDKAHRIEADNQPSIVARTWSRARKLMSLVISPSAVDSVNASNARNAPKRLPTCDLFTIYVKDRRLSVDAAPRIVGDPRTTWSYTVYPVGWKEVPDGTDSDNNPKYRTATIEDSKLYPRGRLLICTKKAVLYDGPNPYWHGMFPVTKLCLDPWPWSLLGLGLVHDIIPIQDALNETLNGILDHIKKLLRPAVVADKKAVANSIWERLDSRVPGIKLKVNPSVGKGVEFVSPEPLPDYTFEMLTWLGTEMDYHAGTANLTALSQLNQVPGENTIEKMQEALSPVLRLKGRLLEFFLREIGEMVKANFFQFYNLPRRVAILGDAGMVFNDFDFDPGSLIPAYSKDDPNYSWDLDKSRPRSERARWFHKNFTFTITPNSLLAISQMTRKLMYMQLRSMTPPLVDKWTLWEVLEVPNGGTPPGGEQTIDMRLIAEQMQMAQIQPIVQATAMAGAMGAAGMMGSAPEGRPSTYQEAPSLQQKSDPNGVPRQTVSATGSGGEPPS